MYQTLATEPFSNRLIQQKFDQLQYDLHKNKVEKALPTVQTRPPNIYPHLALKLNHFEIESQRHKKIVTENRRLVKALIETAKGQCSFDIRNNYMGKSLNHRQRKQVDIAINRENERLANRLINTKSYYGSQKFEKEWLKIESAISRISHYDHTNWKNKQINQNMPIDQNKPQKPKVIITPATPVWSHQQKRSTAIDASKRYRSKSYDVAVTITEKHKAYSGETKI